MFNDPKLKSAFTKAIKHYFEDNDFEEYNKAHGERKFSKQYFDTLDQELNSPVPEDEKTKPSKKKGKK